jgi:holdfast attachment protein HfaA
MGRTLLAGAVALLAVLATADVAEAQSASSTASQFSRGYNSGLSSFTQPVNVSTRDANGNLVITDGVIQTGDGSMLGKLSVAGVQNEVSGAQTSGAGSASAIGNNLQVSVSGNYNTVIVNANQTNNGSVTATTTTVLNGKINLDGGQ